VSIARLLPLGLRRRRLARAAPPGPLRAFYEASLPPMTANWRDAEFLALDLETTGRDPRTEQIVSAGWVEVRHAAIDLGTARRRLMRTSKAMPECSAVVHAITDDEASSGEPFAAVLADLLDALAGRVLIAHYAPTELGFIDAACRSCFGVGLVTPVVDTLQIAQKELARLGQPPVKGRLRLAALRDVHNLPRHTMHDALSDAVAAAELFLAQMETLDAAGPVTLKMILAHA
jgi:DNA polymerase-3 subunit epsilon